RGSQRGILQPPAAQRNPPPTPPSMLRIQGGEQSLTGQATATGHPVLPLAAAGRKGELEGDSSSVHGHKNPPPAPPSVLRIQGGGQSPNSQATTAKRPRHPGEGRDPVKTPIPAASRDSFRTKIPPHQPTRARMAFRRLKAT